MSGNNRIEDFGEKIGGARKDLYTSLRGLSILDILTMTDLEIFDLRIKEATWVIHDFEEYCEKYSIDPVVAYYIRAIRKSIPSKVDLKKYRLEPKVVAAIYSDVIKYIRDSVLEFNVTRFKTDTVDVNSPVAVDMFCDNLRSSIDKIYSSEYTLEIGNRIVELKEGLGVKYKDLDLKEMAGLFCYFLKQFGIKLRKIMMYQNQLFYRAKLHNFPYGLSSNIEKLTIRRYVTGTSFYVTSSYKDIKRIIGEEQEIFHSGVFSSFDNMKRAVDKLDGLVEVYKNGIKKSGEEEKLKLERPQLDHIERIGPAVRKGNVEPKDFLDIFKFRGGEFGNWNTQPDRQAVLNYGFDALADLAYAINVPLDFVTFDDNYMRLALAFGSRGKGRALAHYEPGRHVINLTKMRGAGSLAHEWGHAFDRYLAIITGSSDTFLTDSYKSATNHPRIVKQMEAVMSAMKIIPIECKDERKYVTDLKYRESLMNVDAIIITGNSIRKKIKEAEDKESVDKLLNLKDIMSELSKYVLKIDSSDEDLVALDKLLDRCKYIEFGTNLAPIKMKVYRCIEVAINNYKSRLRVKEQIDDGVYTSDIDTIYYKDALVFDSGKAKPYYSTRVEMFARAFETSVQKILESRGIKSQYLVHSTNMTISYAGLEVSTYPRGKELDRIVNEIERLVEIIKDELGLKDNELIGLYADIRNFNKYSSDKEETHRKVRKSIENEKDVNRVESKQSVSLNDSVRDILVSFYGNNTTRAGLSEESISENISKYIDTGKRLGFRDIGLVDFKAKGIVGSGNSKAFTILNRRGSIILGVDGNTKREKQLEALIEGIISQVVYSKYGMNQASSMIIEGCTYSICKGIGLDVRTYCLSGDFEELDKDKNQKKSYLNICKKVCNVAYTK